MRTASLAVVDVLGREVYNVAGDALTAGATISIASRDLASGIYLVSLSGGSGDATTVIHHVH